MSPLSALCLRRFPALSLFVLPLLAVCVQAKPDPLQAEIEAALQRTVPVSANEPIPVVDFLRPARLSRLKLNPSGTAYSARISSGEDQNDLYVYDFSSNKAYGTKGRLSDGRLYDVLDHHWLDDANLVYRVGRNRQLDWGILSATFTSFDRPRVVSQAGACSWLGQPVAESKLPYVSFNAKGPEMIERGPVQIDPLRCSAPDRISSFFADIRREYPLPPAGTPVRYLTDNLGELRFAVTHDAGELTLWYLVENKKWKRSPITMEKWNIRGPGNNPDELTAVRVGDPGDVSRLVLVDVRTGAEKGLLHEDAAFSLSRAGLIRAGATRRIIGLEYERNGPFIKWLDADYAAFHDGISNTFKGMSVRIESMSRDEQTLILAAHNDQTPVRYYLLKREGLQVQPLTPSRPWIDPTRMSRMKRVNFTTRDGLSMEAYVTLPAGASPEKPVPLVVMPHAGPIARDFLAWHPGAQLLASRGYAVLQPNYRGSQGYLWKSAKNAKDDLPDFARMHEDVTDAVKALLKTGVVDKDRIAIMGSAFGGYLSLCGATYEPALYRCAVIRDRIFEWELVSKESKQHDDNDGRFEILKGAPGNNPKLLEKLSPLKNVSNVRIPLFVAHVGATDYHRRAQKDAASRGFGGNILILENDGKRTTYTTEGIQLLEELRRLKRPHEELLEEGDERSHEMLDQRVRLCTAILAFLDRNMGPVEAK